jgi:predicted dehydrogenase
MNTYRTLIVGVGSIGERHLRCFQNTGRATVAICERNAKLREDVASRYNVEQTFDDLDAAVAAGFDAAVIATPAPLHIPMATRLASSGMHLMIEKPLSITLDGIDQLQAAIAKSRVTITVGYTWRNHPLLAEFKALIDGGTIGEPKHLMLTTGQNFAYHRPAYRDIYYADRKQGGGAVQDGMTHMLNLGEWLVGPIGRLAADVAHQALEGVDVEDTVNIVARQNGNVLATYALNQFQAPNLMTVVVAGDKGTIEFKGHENTLRWMVETEGPWQSKSIDKLERDSMYIAQANHFFDAIEGKVPPLCSLDEAVQTLKVNIAALAAAESNAWLAIE